MSITTNIGIEGAYYGKYTPTKEGYIFSKLGRKATLENIYEVIDDGDENVFLKLSTDFLGKRKYAYILEGHFMEPKTVKSLANIGFDVTTATFNAFVDSIRIQLEAIDEQGYGPTPAYEFLGWTHPPDEDEKVLYYRAAKLIGYPQDAKYIGNYDVDPRGSCDTWRDMVIKDVVPYPTLQLVLIAALASVVIGILSFATPIENPVVHLNLPSGRGKSTAGYLAASILGRPFDGTLPVKDEDGQTVDRHSLYQSWGSTDNAMIATQAGNRGAVVVLNELGKSLTKNMTRIIFDLSEGSDKKRLTSTMEQRSSKGYATTFISTGESSLLDKCDTKLEGLAVRVMEISSDLTKDSFHANRIKDTCFANCGHAAPMMAQYILDNGGIDFVLPKYKQSITDLRAIFPPSPSKDRFVEKFVASFMTTLDIAKEALDIPFDRQSLLNYLLAYDQEHGTERNVARCSYDIILDSCRTNITSFYRPNEESPRGKIYGRVSYPGKLLPDGRYVAEEYELRKDFLEALLKSKGFPNISTCAKEWKAMGVLNHETGRLTRARKVIPMTHTTEDVYVFRVFGDPPTPKKVLTSKIAKQPPVHQPLTRPSPQMVTLLDNDKEDFEND